MGAHILGDFRSQPHCYLNEDYFKTRDCWVDCRTPDMLYISALANIGWDVKLVVQSHNPDPGRFGEVTSRKIIIGDDAFIAGFAILYNCTIGEGAVVAVGSVVRSMIVPRYTMVAGNPAKIIKVYDFDIKRWRKV